ncbi:MAG TPA: co-chaperone GroES [Savagea sp.]
MLKPLGDRIVIEIVEVQETTASGIVLPDSAQEKPQEGKVIAVSKDAKFGIQEGDRIIFSKFSGTDVKYGGTDYLILRESDVLAIVE